MPSVSVIVPIFNGTAYLPTFFASLDAALPAGSQVVLVDDGSSERVWETVPDLVRAGQVLRLQNDRNLGYSATVNRGFAVATGDVVVQINTDLVLDVACIEALADLVTRERDVGIVGSKLVYPTTGLVQHVGMAFGAHSKPHIYRGLPADHPLCCRTREVQIATGATVATTAAVLERLGPLDETYFNHNDDIDHCLRARRLGLRNFTSAESVAHHWESQSGPSRFARVLEAEARFWAAWSSGYEVDLGRFVDEALDVVMNAAPELAERPFVLVDLSRGGDRDLVVERLEARWPRLSDDVRSVRQMNNADALLWLPLLLPHWTVAEPVPFIYLVDDHRDLVENVLWFRTRREVVDDELIVDLAASVVRTSEVF